MNNSASPAARHIVLCSDGTGNSTFKDRGTNVFKLFEALKLDDHHDNDPLPRQIAFYDDGVGTSTFLPEKILGEVFGYGLRRNVLSLYSRLCETWRGPQDRIFLFGFSRGAFTVRTLAHLVGVAGVIDKQRFFEGNPSATESDFQELLRELWATRFSREPLTRTESVQIAFVGVWDTVDAVGIPFEEISELANMHYQFKFPDHELPENVQCARQALSIDDQRQTFLPKIWVEQDGETRIRQVWFPGVHSNVGGGYPKQGMSLEALDWMMSEAEQVGLRFVDTDRRAVMDRRNVNDKLYDSRVGLASFYRFAPRDIAGLCYEAGISQPLVHESLFDRLDLRPEGYAPANIPTEFRIETTLRPGADKKLQRPAPRFRPSREIPDLSGSRRNKVKAIQSGQNAMILLALMGIAALVGLGAWRFFGWIPSGSSTLWASAGFTFATALLFPLSASTHTPDQPLSLRLADNGIWSFFSLLALGNVATLASANALLSPVTKKGFLASYPVFIAAMAVLSLLVWIAFRVMEWRRRTHGVSATLELGKLTALIGFGVCYPALLPHVFAKSFSIGTTTLLASQAILFCLGAMELGRQLRKTERSAPIGNSPRTAQENKIWPFLALALPSLLGVAFAPSVAACRAIPKGAVPWVFYPISFAVAALVLLSLFRFVRGAKTHAAFREELADAWR